MDTWFTSDTHFGHANVIDYCDRPFEDVEEMDAEMVRRWNALVKPGDRVYHLGDFAWTLKRAREIRPQLNGTIRLIIGNHDDIKGLVTAGLFQRVEFWRHFREHGFTATHLPLRREQLRHGDWNVHGHTHNNDEASEPFHINICVEHTAYAPLHLEEVLNKIRTTQ